MILTQLLQYFIPRTFLFQYTEACTRSIAILLIAFGLSACETQPHWSPNDPLNTDVFPGARWNKVAQPEDLGWSSKILQQAAAFSKAIGSTAVMVVQSGVVVGAWGQIATKSNLHSVRKSLLSALLGMAVSEGRINLSTNLKTLNIDDNAPSLTEIEQQATVGDLIKTRSGIYHPALYETAKMTASKPPRGSHHPGSFWHYNNWDFNALGTIYEQQTNEKIFAAFKRRIAVPLQMEDFEISDGSYVSGPASIHQAYPFRMTARDLARFALLYLRQGRWREQQLLSKKWVLESTATHSSLSNIKGYGYMWWTGHGKGLFPNVKIFGHSYYAAGYKGQYAFIFPHLDLVIVHRVNTDTQSTSPSAYQIGRLIWMILSARGEHNIGPDPGIEASKGVRLDTPGIKRNLVGRTVTGHSRNGSPWRVSFEPDGKLTGVAGWGNEYADTGRWTIYDNLYCRQWEEWSNNEEICSTLVQVGTKYKIFDRTGTYRGTMTPVPP